METNAPSTRPARVRGLHWIWGAVTVAWAVAVPIGLHVLQQAELHSAAHRTETAMRSRARDVGRLQLEIAKLPVHDATQATQDASHVLDSTVAGLTDSLPGEIETLSSTIASTS